MKTDELIAQLAANPLGGSVLMSPTKRFLLWSGLSLPVGFALLLALRGTLPAVTGTAFFPIFLGLAIMACAGVAALRSCVPGIRMGPPAIAALLFLGALLFWPMVSPWSKTDGSYRMQFAAELPCAQHVLLASLAGLALLMVLVQRGFSLRPRRTGLLVGLASAAGAVALLRLFCGLDVAGHSLTFHLAPVAIVMLLGSSTAGLLARLRQAPGLR